MKLFASFGSASTLVPAASSVKRFPQEACPASRSDAPKPIAFGLTDPLNCPLVITGCGVVSPAGAGVEVLWQAVRAGRPLDSPLCGPAFARLPIRHAGVIPPDVEPRLPFAGARVASLMALAAEEAIAQAGWDRSTLSDVATALSAATSKGDPGAILAVRRNWLARRLMDGQADAFLRSWPDGPGSLLARHLAMSGPRGCSVAACATGTHALVRAAGLIRDGDARRALVVAGDASVVPLLIGAFARMGVLSPDRCRPFDRDRRGFVLSEGAAAVTLERADEAVGRPLAALDAWLIGADPSGLTAQDATGRTLARSIRLLLDRAGLTPFGVALYSAHGTATPSNDRLEAAAVRTAFGGHAGSLRVMAAKSVLGHLLGAAGLAEAVLAIQAMRRGFHPPIANLENPDPECDLRIVRAGEPADLPTAICASLGFGGQLGLLALSRCD